MARTFVRHAPLPTVPQRPQLDGMALGKQFADTIRRNKTMGAINKALDQHGTLSSPAAIETVRQNMGTWFSDPEKIIQLQDNLFTMEKGLREEARKDREIKQKDALLDIQERQVAVTEAQQILAEDKARVDQEEFEITDRFRRDELQVTKDRYAATIAQLEAATELAREKHEIDTLIKYIDKEVEWITTDEARIKDLMLQFDPTNPVWESHLRLLKKHRDDYTGRLESIVNRTETDFPIDPLSEEFLRTGKSPVSRTEDYDPLPSTATILRTRREDILKNMSHEAVLEFLPDAFFNKREPADRFKEIFDDLRNQEKKLRTEQTRKESPQSEASIKRIKANIKSLDETLYKIREQEKENILKKMKLTEEPAGTPRRDDLSTRPGLVDARRTDVQLTDVEQDTVFGTLTDAALEKLSIKFGVPVEDIKQELDL